MSPGNGAVARLRQVMRALEPATTRRDRTDHEHMRAILAAVLTPESDCIDVGAHEGAVLADMVRLAPRGRHIAYEPLPQFAASLVRRFPEVDVRQRALSDRNGEADFVHVITRPGWSGFRARPYPGRETVRHITVAVEPLDSALNPEHRPELIKIDVEGAEEQVLRGAVETIRRHRPVVVFEHGLGSADYYGTRPEAIHALLTDECGLAIFDLEGGGPYSPERFTSAFDGAERVNFLARPYGDRR